MMTATRDIQHDEELSKEYGRRSNAIYDQMADLYTSYEYAQRMWPRITSALMETIPTIEVRGALSTWRNEGLLSIWWDVKTKEEIPLVLRALARLGLHPIADRSSTRDDCSSWSWQLTDDNTPPHENEWGRRSPDIKLAANWSFDEGSHCKLVKVGTKLVEQSVYKIVCEGEPDDNASD